jgi:hypothetical protein
MRDGPHATEPWEPFGATGEEPKRGKEEKGGGLLQVLQEER